LKLARHLQLEYDFRFFYQEWYLILGRGFFLFGIAPIIYA
jgi:hypothetical protein